MERRFLETALAESKGIRINLLAKELASRARAFSLSSAQEMRLNTPTVKTHGGSVGGPIRDGPRMVPELVCRVDAGSRTATRSGRREPAKPSVAPPATQVLRARRRPEATALARNPQRHAFRGKHQRLSPVDPRSARVRIRATSDIDLLQSRRGRGSTHCPPAPVFTAPSPQPRVGCNTQAPCAAVVAASPARSHVSAAPPCSRDDHAHSRGTVDRRPVQVAPQLHTLARADKGPIIAVSRSPKISRSASARSMGPGKRGTTPAGCRRSAAVAAA